MPGCCIYPWVLGEWKGMIYKMILIALILNILNYFVLFQLMPDISVGVFFLICYIGPLLYNISLYIYSLSKNDNSNNRDLILLPSLTTIAYTVSSLFIVRSGKYEFFMNNKAINTGSVSININDNLFSLSQVVILFILYFGILYITKKIRSSKQDDRS